MRISNGDIGLNVEVDGADDAPPVLLLHGILGSAPTWQWLVDDLAPTHRVLRLDFRGHGASDRAAGRYDLPGYLSDAVAVCEQVAGRPAAVVGHSLGGATAAALAQSRPDLVTGIVMEDPPLRMPNSDEQSPLVATFGLIRQMLPGVQAAGTSPADFSLVMAASPGSTGQPLGELLHGDALLAMAEAMLAVDPTVLDPVIAGRLDTIARPELTMGVPVALVAADPSFPDHVTRPVDLEIVAAANPSALTHTMVGSGHLIHDSKSGREEFGRMVVDFVSRL